MEWLDKLASSQVKPVSVPESGWADEEIIIDEEPEWGVDSDIVVDNIPFANENISVQNPYNPNDSRSALTQLMRDIIPAINSNEFHKVVPQIAQLSEPDKQNLLTYMVFVIPTVKPLQAFTACRQTTELLYDTSSLSQLVQLDNIAEEALSQFISGYDISVMGQVQKLSEFDRLLVPKVNKHLTKEINQLVSLLLRYQQECSVLPRVIIKEQMTRKYELFVKMVTSQIASDIQDLDIETNEKVNEVLAPLAALKGWYKADTRLIDDLQFVLTKGLRDISDRFQGKQLVMAPSAIRQLVEARFAESALRATILNPIY